MSAGGAGWGEARATAYVALGSNLGDRAARLAFALAALASLPDTALVAFSPVYETEPVGGPPQGPYLNAVVALRTGLAPRALLEALLRIEASAGRERGAERNAPRVLDLDLLLYGTLRVDEPGLELPHPRLAERAFVLEPLRDLAPALLHPALGEPIRVLARRVHDPRAVRPWPDVLRGEGCDANARRDPAAQEDRQWPSPR